MTLAFTIHSETENAIYADSLLIEERPDALKTRLLYSAKQDYFDLMYLKTFLVDKRIALTISGSNCMELSYEIGLISRLGSYEEKVEKLKSITLEGHRTLHVLTLEDSKPRLREHKLSGVVDLCDGLSTHGAIECKVDFLDACKNENQNRIENVSLLACVASDLESRPFGSPRNITSSLYGGQFFGVKYDNRKEALIYDNEVFKILVAGNANMKLIKDVFSTRFKIETDMPGDHIEITKVFLDRPAPVVGIQINNGVSYIYSPLIKEGQILKFKNIQKVELLNKMNGLIY